MNTYTAAQPLEFSEFLIGEKLRTFRSAASPLFAMNDGLYLRHRADIFRVESRTFPSTRRGLPYIFYLPVQPPPLVSKVLKDRPPPI